MKVQTAVVDEIERIGVGVDQAFTINFDAKMARILADGLYSDKVQSVIRELSCNAWDSHVMAGKVDTPFQVHFPTTLEPWFSVQDFGVGLSHQQVLDIYTRYGASTKTDSNDVIGQLGLGSKSPFALTNAFDVTARKGGSENHYSMYRNEHGMPCVAHLGENTTTEQDGVIVKVPVRSEQRREFMDKAREVYKWFPVKPVFNGIDQLDIETFENFYEGTSWRILQRKPNTGYRSYTLRPMALMGMVAYPLEINNIHGLRDDQKAILMLPLVLEFAIGDLEVAANREALGYDDRTVSNIKAKLDLLLTELGDQLSHLIASSATEYEARTRFGEIFSFSNDMHYEFSLAFGKRGLHWNGQKIKGSTMQVKVEDIYPRDKDGHSTDAIWQCNDGAKRPRRSVFMKGDTFSLRCEKKTVVFFDDIDKGGLTRVREFNKLVDYKHNIVIFGKRDNVTTESLSQLMGGVEVKLTSSLPKPERVKVERTSMLRWRGGNGKSKSWEPVDIDLEDGGYYVELKGWSVDAGSRIESDVAQFIRAIKQAGVIREDTEIYAMRDKNRAAVRKHPDWQELFAYAKQDVEKQVAQKNLGQLVADSNDYSSLVSNSNWAPWDHLQDLKEDSPMAIFCEKVREIKRTNGQMSQHTNALKQMSSYFGIQLASSTPKYSLSAEYQLIRQRYPMLDFVGSRYYSNLSALEIKRAKDYVDFVDMCETFYKLTQDDTPVD